MHRIRTKHAFRALVHEPRTQKGVRDDEPPSDGEVRAFILVSGHLPRALSLFLWVAVTVPASTVSGLLKNNHSRGRPMNFCELFYRAPFAYGESGDVVVVIVGWSAFSCPPVCACMPRFSTEATDRNPTQNEAKGEGRVRARVLCCPLRLPLFFLFFLFVLQQIICGATSCVADASATAS